MRLKEWLKRRQVTVEELARAADVSRPTVYAALAGKVAFVRVAKAISFATGGQVSIDDVTFKVPPLRARRAEKRAA
jgi:transcriptional regulator with XRE-family HTH domain